MATMLPLKKKRTTKKPLQIFLFFENPDIFWDSPNTCFIFPMTLHSCLHTGSGQAFGKKAKSTVTVCPRLQLADWWLSFFLRKINLTLYILYQNWNKTKRKAWSAYKWESGGKKNKIIIILMIINKVNIMVWNKNVMSTVRHPVTWALWKGFKSGTTSLHDRQTTVLSFSGTLFYLISLGARIKASQHQGLVVLWSSLFHFRG